ncbi:MAG: hypothetical protein LC795_17770 [Acidobacteria bacterium]|nr:hypothetical protein [Acidobacteriota bacterium]
MNRARSISILVSILLTLAGAFPAAAQGDRAMRPQYGGFGLEVLVGGGPLEVLYGRGRRYVEAREGEEYSLLVRNPLPVRVAVALSVDGLNTIDARRTSAWDASKWVIEPYGTVRISGWQATSTATRWCGWGFCRARGATTGRCAGASARAASRSRATAPSRRAEHGAPASAAARNFGTAPQNFGTDAGPPRLNVRSPPRTERK